MFLKRLSFFTASSQKPEVVSTSIIYLFINMSSLNVIRSRGKATSLPPPEPALPQHQIYNKSLHIGPWNPGFIMKNRKHSNFNLLEKRFHVNILALNEAKQGLCPWGGGGARCLTEGHLLLCAPSGCENVDISHRRAAPSFGWDWKICPGSRSGAAIMLPSFPGLRLLL